jgi:hypothetical protein
MIDSLARLLTENGLEPDSFTPSDGREAMYRGELPAGQVVATWVRLAGGFKETGYYPIVRGGSDDAHAPIERDAGPILASVPAGVIGEILRPRFEARRDSLCEMMPDLAEASDMYQLAAMADAAGINSFGGDAEASREWPAEPTRRDRVAFKTLKGRSKQPSTVLLIRTEHPYDVPAYLQFGGWNDCPAPELQVAVLREWKNEYQAVPAAITGDVLECVVVKRPKTEAQSMKLAAEQWIFCEDIVAQGTQSVRNLAIELWGCPNWFFWWD